MVRSFGLAVAVLAGAALLSGCGDGEKLYDVSGTITFEGKPIPKGLIFFDPDPTKGTPGNLGSESGEASGSGDAQGTDEVK